MAAPAFAESELDSEGSRQSCEIGVARLREGLPIDPFQGPYGLVVPADRFGHFGVADLVAEGG